MENKKAVLVIILAIFLAFVVVFFMSKNSAKISLPTNKEIIPTTEKVLTPEQTDDGDRILIPKTNFVTEPVKTKQEYIETPIIKPLKVEEIKQESQENTDTVNNTDSSVVKDDSNEIVITREFKFESPAKYSFKGYGTLDNSSK